MDTNVTDVLASCAGRTLFGSAARSIVAIGVVSCLAVGGFTATGAGAALNAQPQNTISIDRTSKGDRLPVVLKRTPTTSSPYLSTLQRPPIGCDPAFSRTAEPERAHIFGRCIS